MSYNVKAEEYLEPHVDPFIKFIENHSTNKVSVLETIRMWEKYSTKYIAHTLEYRLLFLRMVQERYVELSKTPPSIITHSKQVEHV